MNQGKWRAIKEEEDAESKSLTSAIVNNKETCSQKLLLTNAPNQ